MIINSEVYHDPNFNEEEESLLSRKKEKGGYLTVSYSSVDDYSIQSTSSVDSVEHELTESKKSQISQSSILLTLIEIVKDDRGSNLFLTVCSLLQTLQGSAILGIPYAFLVGGITLIPAAIFISILAEISTRLLIDCLYEISPRSQVRKRIYDGYDDLALACWGKMGCSFVKSMNFVYFIMNNVVNIVLLFKCADNLLGHHVPLTQNQLGCLFSLLLFPFLLIRKLSIMAYFCFVATIAVIVACITSFVVFVQHSHDWQSNFKEIPTFSLEDYPLAIGIIMYTLIIAPTLPNIEGTMTNRKQLPLALHISFGGSSVIKIVFGIIGVLTFGTSTLQLVATNVAELSAAARYIMSIMLIMYALCNTSFFNYIILEQCDKFMKDNVTPKVVYGRKFFIPWMAVSRILCVLILVGTSMVMPFFALVSGVVGATCGCFLALIAPILFHLKLKRHELTTVRKLFEIGLLILSILVCVLTTYSSLNELIKAIRAHHDI